VNPPPGSVVGFGVAVAGAGGSSAVERPVESIPITPPTCPGAGGGCPGASAPCSDAALGGGPEGFVSKPGGKVPGSVRGAGGGDVNCCVSADGAVSKPGGSVPGAVLGVGAGATCDGAGTGGTVSNP
jgi:hypothetical protein